MAIQQDAERVAAEILKDPDTAPELMRRCIVSVMKQPQVRGRSLREKFTGAVAISLNSLRNADPGRMQQAGRRPNKPMTLTGFGFKRQNVKRMDGTTSKKVREFKRLVDAVNAEQKKGQQQATLPGRRQ